MVNLRAGNVSTTLDITRVSADMSPFDDIGVCLDVTWRSGVATALRSRFTQPLAAEHPDQSVGSRFSNRRSNIRYAAAAPAFHVSDTQPPPDAGNPSFVKWAWQVDGSPPGVRDGRQSLDPPAPVLDAEVLNSYSRSTLSF